MGPCGVNCQQFSCVKLGTGYPMSRTCSFGVRKPRSRLIAESLEAPWAPWSYGDPMLFSCCSAASMGRFLGFSCSIYIVSLASMSRLVKLPEWCHLECEPRVPPWFDPSHPFVQRPWTSPCRASVPGSTWQLESQKRPGMAMSGLPS